MRLTIQGSIAGAVVLASAFFIGRAIVGEGNNYSNGWYGYTVTFPENTALTYGGNIFATDRVLTHAIRAYRGKEALCRISVALGMPGSALELPPQNILITERKWVTMKSGKWVYVAFSANPGNPVYETQGAAWVTYREPFTYTVSASADFAKTAEQVATTFRMHKDKRTLSAELANGAKQAALLYAGNRFPEKRFTGGAFLEASPLDPKELTEPGYPLRAGALALVEFGTPKGEAFDDRTGLVLEYQERKWVVTGTRISNADVQPWSWLVDVL